jgi:hypothetical protein
MRGSYDKGTNPNKHFTRRTIAPKAVRQSGKFNFLIAGSEFFRK